MHARRRESDHRARRIQGSHNNDCSTPESATMKTYRARTPSFAIGVAAVALSIATIGAAVVAPARMNFRSAEVPVIAVTSAPATLHDAADARVVDVIDVSAVRESRLVTVVEPLHASRRG
jgi:hypothetical protein